MAAAAVAIAAAGAAVPRADAAVRVSVDRESPAGESRLALGVTHNQHSLDPWGDPAAVARGWRLLDRAVTFHNQHIYGWGTRNPNPAPGVFDWKSLDRRMAGIRASGGTPVITLCCAPDWMTALGTPTSTYPNVPPTEANHAAFAELARQVARRYPYVKHYLVWNEMKGFWDHAANNWDFAAYTRMYNAVHDALKSVDRSIRVGGPYLVIEGTGSRSLGKTGYGTAAPITERNREVLSHWLARSRGADFLAVDRKTVSNSHDRHDYTRAQQLSFTRWFGETTRQLRALTDLPVWYAEDYFVDDGGLRFQAAGLAAMLREHVLSGAAVSLRWGPQGRDEPGGRAQSLFSDTRSANGGRPYPAYRVYRAFHRHFGRGARLWRARSTAPGRVDVLASRSATLLINRRAAPVQVRIGPRSVRLGRYGVRVLQP